MDRRFLLFVKSGAWSFSFEFLSHGTHSVIFNDIVFSDLTSHTCSISNILIDHGKKISVAGIGAIKYILCV